MHQLRVHLADSGHSIVGDKIYTGAGEAYLEWLDTGWTAALCNQLHLPRHALHACKLEVPWRGESLDWISALPEDLHEFVAGKPITERPGVVIWDRHD